MLKNKHTIYVVTKNDDFTGDILPTSSFFSSKSFPNHMDPGGFLFIFVEVSYGNHDVKFHEVLGFWDF